MRMLGKVARRGEGFTIVELMVTLLILGVLVGIVIMTMTISREKAREAACKANLRTIHAAIVQYQAWSEGEYPDADDQDELFELLIPSAGSTAPGSTAPDFLKGPVRCPSGGTYTYDKVTGTIECSKASHNP